MKVLRVVGARPQFMQVPVLREQLLERGHVHTLIHTGQHFDDDMSAVFFRELGLPDADANLGISGLAHGAMTGRMMEALEQSIRLHAPDIVLVDGDTNSTMAAALAAVKLHVPVVHVEAGLRDFDRRRPEEINRIVTDHVASLNCAPIPRALHNLRSEGMADRAVLTGDLLLDCYLQNFERRDRSIAGDLNLRPEGYHLATLHRPENTDPENFDRFRDIMDFLAALDKPVLLPLHPRTRPRLQSYVNRGGNIGAIRVMSPVTYLQMLGLLEGADCVITDSGGLPREATWSGCRCVMLFQMDTWHDLLANGWATIGKSDRSSIERAFSTSRRPETAEVRQFFGGGRAAARICAAIEELDKRAC